MENFDSINNSCADEFDWEKLIRVRSQRSKKREIYKARDKKLIRLHKEEKELAQRKRNLPMIDLTPPIQRGWKRYFIVREDIRRSKQGFFYGNLLQKINTFQYSDRKDFKRKKKRKGRKVYELRKQQLRIFYPNEISKMKFTPNELACLVLKTKVEMKGKKIVETQYYEMIEPWRYVLRIRPNIIDKVQVFDSELEKHLAELHSILFDNYINRGRLSHLRGWKGSKWINPKKYQNPLKNVPLYKIIENNE